MDTMVSERSRREPSGEAKNWKNKRKVWHKLDKGGITKFFEKLYGFDVEITKLMVDSWTRKRRPILSKIL